MITFDAAVVGPWVCERAGGTWVPGRGTAIGLTKDGELVAGVLYEDWNGANVVCHIAGESGWARRSFLWMIFDYPFRQMKAKRITVPIASTNDRCMRFVRDLGFVHEFSLKEAHPEGDIELFVMRPDQCRWLELGEKGHGKEQRPSGA